MEPNDQTPPPPAVLKDRTHRLRVSAPSPFSAHPPQCLADSPISFSAKDTMGWVVVNQPGEGSSSRRHRRGGGGGGASPAADRLSALPGALLHHVMSFMKAWDVARTYVLSQRWRLRALPITGLPVSVRLLPISFSMESREHPPPQLAGVWCAEGSITHRRRSRSSHCPCEEHAARLILLRRARHLFDGMLPKVTKRRHLHRPEGIQEEAVIVVEGEEEMTCQWYNRRSRQRYLLRDRRLDRLPVYSANLHQTPVLNLQQRGTTRLRLQQNRLCRQILLNLLWLIRDLLQMQLKNFLLSNNLICRLRRPDDAPPLTRRPSHEVNPPLSSKSSMQGLHRRLVAL
ncbi:hypothetical protein HU200_005028 [Digitaria exilis]|uniref:F-box domain-containing protein n=1 Tax=Digitaria exilis TaxID=1010633 RepID=A0A835KRS9_9POAL|nr:hypothetical protein HU200_005028 [Digitaria exilis]